MKRDIELIRHLLLEIEKTALGETITTSEIEIVGYSEEEIVYNGLRMRDMGLVELISYPDYDGISLEFLNLTSKGHELIDKIRDNNKFKIFLKKHPEMIITTMIDILLKFL